MRVNHGTARRKKGNAKAYNWSKSLQSECMCRIKLLNTIVDVVASLIGIRVVPLRASFTQRPGRLRSVVSLGRNLLP